MMRVLACLTPLIASLAACSTSNITAVPQPIHGAPTPLVTKVADAPTNETVLLVSLDDGTVIKQMIHAAADICFKQASHTATTCLTEGAPIIDATTNSVIGIEMIENQIELVGKPRQ